jgi:hypothetical protein
MKIPATPQRRILIWISMIADPKVRRSSRSDQVQPARSYSTIERAVIVGADFMLLSSQTSIARADIELSISSVLL